MPVLEGTKIDKCQGDKWFTYNFIALLDMYGLANLKRMRWMFGCLFIMMCTLSNASLKGLDTNSVFMLNPLKGLNVNSEPPKKLSAFRMNSSYNAKIFGLNGERLNFNDKFLGILLGFEFNESKNIYSVGANLWSGETYEIAGAKIGYTKMFTRDNRVNFGMNYDFSISNLSYKATQWGGWTDGTKIVNAGVGFEAQALIFSVNYRVGIGFGGNEVHKQKLVQHGFGAGYFIFIGRDKK